MSFFFGEFSSDEKEVFIGSILFNIRGYLTIELNKFEEKTNVITYLMSTTNESNNLNLATKNDPRIY